MTNLESPSICAICFWRLFFLLLSKSFLLTHLPPKNKTPTKQKKKEMNPHMGEYKPFTLWKFLIIKSYLITISFNHSINSFLNQVCTWNTDFNKCQSCNAKDASLYTTTVCYLHGMTPGEIREERMQQKVAVKLQSQVWTLKLSLKLTRDPAWVQKSFSTRILETGFNV